MQHDAHGPRLGSIFSGKPLTGDDLKEEGISKVMRKELARKYRDQIIEALKIFPVRSRITVDRLTGFVGMPPKELNPNCIGAIIAGMAKQGMIRKTGRMVKSERRYRHANASAEWEMV